MRSDDDSIFGMAGDDDDLVLPATIAPSPDDMFETITLMHLEASRITQDDLPDLSWDNLPAMPETMSDREGPEQARAALLSAAEAHPLILGFMALSARDDLISPTEEYPFHDYQPGTIEETAVWYTLIEDTWQSVEGAFEWAIRCCNEPEFEKLVGAAAMEAAIELEGLIGPLNDIDVDDLLGDLFPDDEDESDDPGLRLI